MESRYQRFDGFQFSVDPPGGCFAVIAEDSRQHGGFLGPDRACWRQAEIGFIEGLGCEPFRRSKANGWGATDAAG
jgi:hypothetical protein